MSIHIILVPAYGRDYKSKKECLSDFNDNKDFKMAPQGCYTNKSDLARVHPNEPINITFRFNKLKNVAVTNLTPENKF